MSATKDINSPWDQSYGQINERAVSVGAHLARRIFEARGNHSEAHLGQDELAQYLALAYELGQNLVTP